MTNRELRIWNDLRPFSVGFENIFDHFNLHLDTQRTVNYPPYNIIKTEENWYELQLAIAGFKDDDLNIEIRDSVLSVKGNKSEEDTNDYIHKGEFE